MATEPRQHLPTGAAAPHGLVTTQDLSSAEQQALALAALVQAAYCIEQIANGRQTADAEVAQLYESLYRTHPKDFSEILPHLDPLAVGITYLRRLLQTQPNDADNRILKYTLAAIQLEKKLIKRPNLLTTLAEKLSELHACYETPEDQLQPNAQSELAELYCATAGTLRPQIEIVGKTDIINQAANAAKIRSLLLTAIRFATLWRQLGGRRWQLVLRQGQILAILDQLYDRLSAKHSLH